MPLNLGGFNPGIPTQGSDYSQWREAASQTAGAYSRAMSELINAFQGQSPSGTQQTNNTSGSTPQSTTPPPSKTELIQMAQVNFEQAKQMFELFQNMFKNASETIMSVIRRLDPR